MSDPLYLSLWFSDFSGPAMLPHILAVLQQFPFSERRPGVTYVAVQPVSWNEASVLERRFSPGVAPQEAVVVAADLVHDDYAYVFDAYWDMWTLDTSGNWNLGPSQVKIIAQGEEFEEGVQQETGHIEIDFGLDSLFIQEGAKLTSETEARIRENVLRLIEFSKKVEMHRHAIALHLMHYNFARVHQTLRVSPAQAAGVTAHLWSVEEIAGLLEAGASERLMA